MGDIIRVIVALLMIVSILIIVQKKWYVPVGFMSIGIIVMIVLTIVTGTSVLPEEATSGNAFVDCFETISNAITQSLGSTGLVIMVVMGYVGYMTKIKAAELFSIVLGKPLRHLKHKEILIVATFAITVIVKLAIPSGVSEVTLLLATVYPILLAVGITNATAAATFLVAINMSIWGPANTLALTALSAAGLDNYSLPVYFVTKEVLPIVCMAIVGTIACIIVNKYFDKKECIEVKTSDLPELKGAKELGIPTFYAIFPVMPVVLIIIFSPIIQSYVTMSVVAANFLCFLIVTVIEGIRKHSITEALNDDKAMFEGMGNAFTRIVSVLIGINVFSTALRAVGGLNILAKAFTNIGGTPTMIAIMGAVALFILLVIGSSISGTLPIFCSLYPAFATSENELVNMVRITIFGGVGGALTPIAPTTLVVSEACDVPITRLMKRTLVPAVCCLITEIIVCVLIG